MFGDELYYLIALVLVVAAYFYFRNSSPPPPKFVVKSPPQQQSSKPLPKKRVVEIPSDAKAKIKVLFGSQTGTADDFSHILSKEAKHHGIFAEVIDL